MVTLILTIGVTDDKTDLALHILENWETNNASSVLWAIKYMRTVHLISPEKWGLDGLVKYKVFSLQSEIRTMEKYQDNKYIKNNLKMLVRQLEWYKRIVKYLEQTCYYIPLNYLQN